MYEVNNLIVIIIWLFCREWISCEVWEKSFVRRNEGWVFFLCRDRIFSFWFERVECIDDWMSLLRFNLLEYLFNLWNKLKEEFGVFSDCVFLFRICINNLRVCNDLYIMLMGWYVLFKSFLVLDLVFLKVVDIFLE